MASHRAALLSLLLGSCLGPACAQPPPSAHQPPRVDPLLVAPAESVTPRQVEELQRRLLDWPQLQRYAAANVAEATEAADAASTPEVVFFGDSITQDWGKVEGSVFFPGKPWRNRGISGQTTAQMLVRFRQDVIALSPRVVVILAGTNDIAGNTGHASEQMIMDNLRSMSELARAHDIRVVLASVLPADAYPWRPGVQPAQQIRALNTAIRAYCEEAGLVYLDYHGALSNAGGGLDARDAYDGVHPTAAGYARMAPLAEAAVRMALDQPRR